MIRRRARESICIKTEPHILGNGWTTNRVDTVFRNGWMEPNTKATSKMD